MVKFSKLSINEKGELVETNVRQISQADIGKCPHVIFNPEHYREDGSCKCDDPNAHEMADWGYTWDGKLWSCPEEPDDN